MTFLCDNINQHADESHICNKEFPPFRIFVKLKSLILRGGRRMIGAVDCVSKRVLRELWALRNFAAMRGEVGQGLVSILYNKNVRSFVNMSYHLG